MVKTILARIDDMLEAIDEIRRVTASKSFEEFRQDWLLTKGTERAIEIISEASRHLPDELKSRHPIPAGGMSLVSATSFVTSIIGSRIRSYGQSFGMSCPVSRFTWKPCVRRLRITPSASPTTPPGLSDQPWASSTSSCSRRSLNGLLFGGVLALLALGLNLIFGVIDVVWICYAELIMLGMYAVYFLLRCVRPAAVGRVRGLHPRGGAAGRPVAPPRDPAGAGRRADQPAAGHRRRAVLPAGGRRRSRSASTSRTSACRCRA